MQSLSIISVNIWQILISFANLAILTWIIKKFLFKPVKKVLDSRRETIDSAYARAETAEAEAEEHRKNYAAAMAAAKQTTDQMISDAAREAERRGSEIEGEARERAQEIRRQAELDAQQELRKAEDEMKHEIADISAKLTGKLLEREIQPEDHRELIDSFLQELDG
ncbi:MAG: F0F1 ATP synthase subunit B [Clostridia bacterium]|nr:F0F1 ATP synthase subunit B [Clostridia bacterium]